MDLQKNGDGSTEDFYTPHTHFPVIDILYECGTFVRIYQYWYIIIINQTSYFIQVSLIFTFCPFSVPRSHPR